MWGPQDSYVGEHNYKFVVVRTTNRLDYIATYLGGPHCKNDQKGQCEW